MIESKTIFQSILQTPNINLVKNVPQLKVFKQDLGELVTVSKRSPYNNVQITTEIRNRLGKVLGKEIFTLDENNPFSIGSLISVEPEYRKKNYKFGEILRLSSIIMMLENKIKEFQIYSKSSAIFFHTKYKFEPAISQFKERDQALESVIENCNKHGKDYDDIKNEAELILKEASIKKSSEKQRNLCQKTNTLINKYLKKVMEHKGEYPSHEFKTGIFMKLTSDTILENKSFFNELLKKHNIDYQI